MSQPYVTGPAVIFVGTGTSGALQFLGFTQDGVDMQFVESEQEVRCDPTGPDLPIDVQYTGEQWYGSMMLNRYNEQIFQKCAARRVGAGVTPGTIEANAIGSLMLAEGYAYPLFIYFPYASQKSFESDTAVKCYNFGAAWMPGAWSFTVNTLVKTNRCTFRAIPVFNTTTLSGVLYNNTLPSPIPSWN